MDAPILIIGAGPAGLSLAALLKADSVEHILTEQTDRVGGAYASLYPHLTLLSPSAFLSLPIKKGEWASEMISAGEFHHYLLEYQDHFGIKPLFNKKLEKIRCDKGVATSYFNDGTQIRAKVVVLATGKACFPKEIPFSQESNPLVRHEFAKDFRGPEYYSDKTVLIVGSGTSAAEIATILSAKSKVFIAVKAHFRTMPLFIGKTNIHHFVHYLERLPKVLFKKICAGTRYQPAVDWGFSQKIKDGKINLKVGEVKIQDNHATFDDGESVRVDILINATGYQFNTSFLPDDISKNEKGMVMTKNNQSVSHPQIYILGQPCARKVDSAFIRGICKDSSRLAKRVRAVTRTS